jgi:hypothetical protein
VLVLVLVLEPLVVPLEILLVMPLEWWVPFEPFVAVEVVVAMMKTLWSYG